MSDAVIDAARLHWSLGDAPITLVAARENQVYRVDHTSGPAALRLHRPGYRTNAEINSELQWMAMLAENSIAVPTPLAGTDNTYIQSFSGITVSLIAWVDATPQSQQTVSTGMYSALGTLLARMHNLADAWELPANFSRPTWDLVGDQPTWGKFWENPLLSEKERGLLLRFREDARSAVAKTPERDIGLIHADLVPDNVLSDSSKIWVIDFDDGGFGDRVFDLATITSNSRHRHETNEYADAAVSGYCAARQTNLNALSLFEALRACTYVGWNIARLDEPNAIERNARFIARATDAIGSFYGG